MKQLFKRRDQYYCGTRWQARDRAAYLRVPIDVAVGVTFLGEQLSPHCVDWTGIRPERRCGKDATESRSSNRSGLTVCEGLRWQ
jgi:hypothetical protein